MSSIAKLLRRLYSPPIFKEISKISSIKPAEIRSLNLTDSAATQLKFLSQKFPEKRLRLAVEAGGCHGFQYKFLLEPIDSSESSEDIIFTDTQSQSQSLSHLVQSQSPSTTSENLKPSLICDKISWSMIKDAKLDYSQELIGSAFRIIDNPVADSGCGCGISFDLKDKQ